MKLCGFCNSSKNNFFEEGSPCFICNGALLQLPEIAKKAADIVPASADSFFVSTSLPNEWLAREEAVWDKKLERTVCIKTAINVFLNNEIKKATGKKPKSDGDVIVKINLPTTTVEFRWNDLFIFGKYKKLTTGLSQTRWLCGECEGKGCEKCGGSGKLYHSVEEEIGEALREMTNSKDYTMHASGREDIDVQNEAGRPFIMQLKEAQNRKIDFSLAEKRINAKGNVEVYKMMAAARRAVEIVAASHFDKTYVANVEFDKECNEKRLQKVLALSGTEISQRTPQRVEHRRAFLERKRMILDVKLLSKADKEAEFLITAEAGTYIKELINGDEGRTSPSFSSLTNRRVRCTSLRVVGIKDDFLDLVRLI